MNRLVNRAVVALAIVIVAACGSAAQSEPPPSAGELSHDATPWQSELANVQPDGTRTLESGLTLMAMAFGPVPGVEAATAAKGTVDSASPGVRVARAGLDRLTPEQRAAVEGYLNVPDDAPVLDVPPADGTGNAALPLGALAMTGPAVALRYTDFEREVLEDAQFMRTRAAEFWGDIPSLRVRTYAWEGSPFLTFFNPRFGPNGFESCDVIINRADQNVDREPLRRSMSLDIFHCFQTWRMGSEAGFDGQVPGWAWEGPAEYAVLMAWPTSEVDAQAWQDYIGKPDISLFQRTYDAFAFYAQLFWNNVDDRAAIEAVLNDVDNPERFALAGATANEFLDAWSSDLTATYWGHDWGFSGPGPSSWYGMAAPRQPLAVSNGSLEAVSQDAYSNHNFAVHSSADIVLAEFFGRARIGDGSVDTVIRDSAVFCTTDKGCGPCPDGSQPPIHPTRLAADSVLAVSGGTDGTNGTVSGHPLEEFCLQTPSPRPTPEPKPQACQNGCAMSNGDPHIITVDDSPYDFQAAGEFVLLRSADGSFELQSRQEPYIGSDSVSINTALAMKAGQRRLNVLFDPGTSRLAATVDGAPLDLSQPADLDGTSVSSQPSGIEISAPDGTRVWATGQYGYGILITLEPSDDLRTAGVGVMGPVSPGGAGLPALPDGTLLPPVLGQREYFDQVYGEFADAWRVTAATSLFDYSPGTSTETYALPDFPAAPLTIDDLTPEQLAAGETACAHIGLDFLREQCVFDVALTGDSSFGAIYDVSATLVETGSLRPSGERVRVVNLYSNEDGPTALDVYGWSDAGAALLATVEYGQASSWLDPGSVTNAFGGLDTQLSVQRSGEAVNDFQLNLVDLTRDLVGGVVKTVVIGAGDADAFGGWVGGREATTAELYEHAPAYALMAAPADSALLFLNVQGLVYTSNDVSFFASAGKGCLTQPGLDGLSQQSGVGLQDGSHSWGYEGPLALNPGQGLSITLHDATGIIDPFSFHCDTSPIAGPWPLSIGAGERAHLLLYATPGDATIRSLILPFDK